jgi:hypothetical protein
MKKVVVIEALSPLWKDALKKRGLEKTKKEIEGFEARTKKLLQIEGKTVISFLFSHYHLIAYISFKFSKWQTLRRFWEFSAALAEIKIDHDKGITPDIMWEDLLNQYMDETFNSKEEKIALLLFSQIIPLLKI